MNLLKKNKTVFIIISIVILSVGVISVYQYISSSPKKTVEIAPVYTGNANEFNYLVTDNLSHWISKIVQITGKVTQVNEDGILLNGTIYCQFEDIHDLQSITENQNIVVKGKLVGFDELLMEIKLNQCIIIQ